MFTGVPVPPNDVERVAALKQYRVLDTPPEFEYDAAMAAEQERSEALLRSIFPATVAAELKAGQPVQPRHYDLATVMFVDFTGFTLLTEGTQPAALVQQLHQHFARFDDIVERNRLETLKTIGDAYFWAGGLPEPNRTHAIDACLAALEIQSYLAASNRQREKLRMQPWKVRIGINTGPVVAGLVGKRRFAFDIWGDSVNVAQRLQAAAEPGRINIAASTSHYVGKLFDLEPRGTIDVKNKPPLEMFFLNRIKPEYAADADGLAPNAAFWQAG